MDNCIGCRCGLRTIKTNIVEDTEKITLKQLTHSRMHTLYILVYTGTRYLVVDCGGGTVDITVHELDDAGKLKELYKATGGPYGSLGGSSVGRAFL